MSAAEACRQQNDRIVDARVNDDVATGATRVTVQVKFPIWIVESTGVSSFAVRFRTEWLSLPNEVVE